MRSTLGTAPTVVRMNASSESGGEKRRSGPLARRERQGAVANTRQVWACRDVVVPGGDPVQTLQRVGENTAVPPIQVPTACAAKEDVAVGSALSYLDFVNLDPRAIS